MMADHIGIVAVSAPGAALCYETICAEAPQQMGTHQHPEISMHTFSFADHLPMMEAGDWQGVGRLLVDSATKLASLGAKFAICPDNTVHQAIDLGCAESPIPWLHIAEAVTREAVRIGAKRVGILGTRYLMEGPVYPRVLKAAGIEPQLPKASHRVAIHEIIFGDLVYGRVTDETRSRLQAIVADLQAQGCDAVVLGCTELPLAISPELSPLPTLDSTRLLARAAIRRAIRSPAV